MRAPSRQNGRSDENEFAANGCGYLVFAELIETCARECEIVLLTERGEESPKRARQDIYIYIYTYVSGDEKYMYVWRLFIKMYPLKLYCVVRDIGK